MIHRWQNPANLRDALEKLPRGVSEAVELASEALTKAGVRHAIVGGVAAAAHGYLRATNDVDFLVGDEAFESRGIILTFAPGVPILIGDVPIDCIPITEEEPFLESALNGGVVDVEVLVYMKLKAGRRKDIDDVYHLLEQGADERKIRTYLERNAPRLLGAFDDVIDELDS